MYRSIAVLALAAAGCHSCRAHEHAEDDRDDDDEEAEERDSHQLNYWRVRVVIEGQGSITGIDGTIACSGDGTRQTGRCGPTLYAFDELRPPLLRGTGAAGWKLVRWESQTRQADGRITPRTGPMPDGRWYLNGFGYRDTGAVETVTAVFALAGSAADDHASDVDGH